jgi:hypothetical protein
MSCLRELTIGEQVRETVPTGSFVGKTLIIEREWVVGRMTAPWYANRSGYCFVMLWLSRTATGAILGCKIDGVGEAVYRKLREEEIKTFCAALRFME